MEEKILTLLRSFLGKEGKESGGWHSFNCPVCAEEKGVMYDGKYNLEVKIDLTERGCGGYHCWRCKDTDGTKGRLVSLFKKYASQDVIDEFKDIVNGFREAKKYELFNGTGELPDEFGEESEFTLPEGFRLIREGDVNAQVALDYLTRRGVTSNIIKTYNIGYIGDNPNVHFSLRNRIVVPSYDIFEGLNYWVARDYTGRNKVRYKNPKVSKTQFIFNEGLINWYEPITLVEGPFDHIVVPNSIPLLGKSLGPEYLLYNTIIERSRSLVKVFLDDDALQNAVRIYKLLDENGLHGRVRLIECPKGHDASSVYQFYGKNGILALLSRGKTLDDYTLSKI